MQPASSAGCAFCPKMNICQPNGMGWGVQRRCLMAQRHYAMMMRTNCPVEMVNGTAWKVTHRCELVTVLPCLAAAVAAAPLLSRSTNSSIALAALCMSHFTISQSGLLQDAWTDRCCAEASSLSVSCNSWRPGDLATRLIRCRFLRKQPRRACHGSRCVRALL